jgi:uncharacterized protein with PQ loop repeat
MVKRQKKSSDKMIGYMMYAVAVGMPLTDIPQLIQIFSTKVATGLSLSAWVMYAAFGVVPLMYAVSNKLKPLIISNILWMFVDAAMIYGIVRYSPNLIPHSYDKLLLINNIGKAINQIGLVLLSGAFALFAYDLIEAEKKIKHVRA